MNDEDNRTELARRLVYLAAERTLTSWVRTALSLMAFGFVVDRFGLILDLMPGASNKSQFYRGMLSSRAGSILIGMGAAMALVAGVRYLRFAVEYRRDSSTRVGRGIFVGATFSLVLALFGIALILMLAMIFR
jgi:inner membrane protein YidH